MDEIDNLDAGFQVSDPTADMIDNGDGTFTDAEGNVWENGSVVGFDYGDGTWVDNNGVVYDQSGNAIGEMSGDGTFMPYQDSNAGSGSQTVTPIDLGNQFAGGQQSGGILSWLSNLFGGSGTGGSGTPGGSGSGMSFGSGGSSSRGAQQQAAQQLAQQLQRAQQSGASPQTIAALQRQLASLQAGSGNDSSTTILFVAVAALGAYALTRRKN